MIRKLLLSTAAAAALCSGASAADLPRRTAPVVYAPVPVFTWTGFYIGGNVGAFINDSTISSVPTGSLIPPSAFAITGIGQYGNSIRPDDTRVMGGGQIGFNYQFTPGTGVVIGVEADIQGVDRGDTTAFTTVGVAPPGAGNLTTAVSQRVDYFGTVRGRLGYAFDRFLVYGTGGFAYGDVRTNFSNVFGGPFFSGAQFVGSFSDTRTGYTFGGGVEYALPTDSFLNIFNSSAVTIKAEYLYVDLDPTNFVVPRTVAGGASLPTDTFDIRDETKFHVARVGINFKFGTY